MLAGLPLSLWMPYESLTQLRSFVEHRAHTVPGLRTVVVETNLFWALLFLNNNLHIAHHAWDLYRDIHLRHHRPVITAEHPIVGIE